MNIFRTYRMLLVSGLALCAIGCSPEHNAVSPPPPSKVSHPIDLVVNGGGNIAIEVTPNQVLTWTALRPYVLQKIEFTRPGVCQESSGNVLTAVSGKVTCTVLPQAGSPHFILRYTTFVQAPTSQRVVKCPGCGSTDITGGGSSGSESTTSSGGDGGGTSSGGSSVPAAAHQADTGAGAAAAGHSSVAPGIVPDPGTNQQIDATCSGNAVTVLQDDGAVFLPKKGEYSAVTFNVTPQADDLKWTVTFNAKPGSPCLNPVSGAEPTCQIANSAKPNTYGYTWAIDGCTRALKSNLKVRKP